MTRAVEATTHLSPVESLMWRLEGDPSLSATFGSVTFLDREPDHDRFRTRMLRAVEAVPRLRQRIDTDTLLPASSPTWVEDPTFDLDRHLRWEKASAAGTEQDVLDRAAHMVAEPFERETPPWTFVVITGLPDGRAALVQRMHHAITDGKGGIRISEQFVDLERDTPGPTPDPFLGVDPPGSAPSRVERAINDTVGQAEALARATVGATRWLAGGLADPGRFGTLGSELMATGESLRRQLAVTERARSTLWSGRSGEHRLVASSVPFGPVRAAATGAGVSINDVFVTAALRGVAAYHRISGAPVDELRVAIPVSTRNDIHAGGNAFSPTRVLLPSGDQLAAAAHLQLVSVQLTGTKHERSTGLIEPLAAATEVVPPALLRAVVKWQAGTIDFTASNVRAAPVPLYIAGARIDATYAAGPLAATAANITMMSYDGRIDLGIHVDTGAVSDPELLRDTVVAAIHEVCDAAPTPA